MRWLSAVRQWRIRTKTLLAVAACALLGVILLCSNLENIGVDENGADAAEITLQVFQEISGSVSDAIRIQGGKILKDPGGAIGKAGSSIGKGASRIGKSIGGLFKKKKRKKSP